MLTLFFYLPVPHVPTPFCIICSPPPGTISYCPPIFHLSTPLLSLFEPASSPPYCPVAEWQSTRKTPPHKFRHCSSALPFSASCLKVVLRVSLCLPSSIWLSPFSTLALRSGPCQTQVSPVWGSLSPSVWLTQPHTHPPPPDDLDRRPSPLPA